MAMKSLVWKGRRRTMYEPVRAEPARNEFWTPGVFALIALTLVAVGIAIYRFLFGLTAVTNLDQEHPWGIWIAIDVATGVALAAGGFTTAAALTHIFHRERYAVLVRPALLTAMLGYTFVALGLTVDLGRYYNIWHPIVPSMWQGNSVLFEVGMCVVVYLHVLYIEFLPVVCERFIGAVDLPGPLASLNKPVDTLLRFLDKTLGKVMFLFIIAGVVLSCMHQSSLGGLLLIAPYKMHPLWYTPILPFLFLLSAIAVGFPMVIFESLLASKSFGREPEMHVLSPLAKLVTLTLGVYMIAKGADLLIRDAYK
jgi:Ni/Fe-hydrogenase subunit HybB-like protein